MILTFNRTFRKEEMDLELNIKLQSECSGIFNWAVEGLKRLAQEKKFTEVPSSEAELEEYKIGRNSVALFKRACLKVPENRRSAEGRPIRVLAQIVYMMYCKYCQTNNYQPFAENKFGQKLKELEVEQERSNGARYYVVKLVNLHEAGCDGQIEPYCQPRNIHDEFTA